MQHSSDVGTMERDRNAHVKKLWPFNNRTILTKQIVFMQSLQRVAKEWSADGYGQRKSQPYK